MKAHGKWHCRRRRGEVTLWQHRAEPLTEGVAVHIRHVQPDSGLLCSNPHLPGNVVVAQHTPFDACFEVWTRRLVFRRHDRPGVSFNIAVAHDVVTASAAQMIFRRKSNRKLQEMHRIFDCVNFNAGLAQRKTTKKCFDPSFPPPLPIASTQFALTPKVWYKLINCLIQL